MNWINYAAKTRSISNLEKNNKNNNLIFSDLMVMKRIMFELESLCGSIAYCCALPNDEVVRFNLWVKDLMK